MIKDKPNTNLRENIDLAVSLYDSLERLSTNADFKNLIEYGFMELYALNQVGMLASPGADRPSIYSDLHGISVLSNFLLVIERLGEQAKAAQAEVLESELDSEE
jgi:hypothetical protein